MIKNSDSEFIPAMSASQAFDKIIDNVKLSNLNFCLQLSPFSANIHLKKTLIKDKGGNYLNPAVSDSPILQKHVRENSELCKKVAILENKIADLKVSLEKSKMDFENAQEVIKKLENELSIKQENIESKRKIEAEKSLIAGGEKSGDQKFTFRKRRSSG